MTCVWTGILQALKYNNLIKTKIDEYEFADYIIKHNRETSYVLINGENLKNQEITENFKHINSINNIHSGYYCSSADPLLCLIAEIFNVNIIHEFHSSISLNNKREHNSITIEYSVNSLNTLYVMSRNGHFEMDLQKNKINKKKNRKNLKKTIKS
jgi:hypothetical protein